MKIIRYADNHARIGWAAQNETGYFTIDGDLLGDWQISPRIADVQRILAPIEPRSIFCIGLNYRRHAEETGAKIPEFPVVFMKGANALQNPDNAIEIPSHLASTRVDYEGELAVVIGRGPRGEACKNVSRAEALNYVLGYTIANDVSARDWQKQWGGGQFCRGKTFDTFCPLGPVLITPDEITNPNDLVITTVLNEQTVQSANTSDMIFDVPTLIEFLSGSTTLLPGTVILTGTPEGVGMARTPPLWMKDGDTVSVEIEGIGVLTNAVQAEVER
ncbi:MAG TPA: fumarylacetoacetate hydrolase family protein [Abditibacteriaceae bacterium]|jgi:2-keto-4-pentenoate hydratase/2-oxohepta-3-ene-1,7-dioic acid hydratase in catechol pathway